MAKKQVVTVGTPDGIAEAIREDTKEPWRIGYPFGDDTFYGDKKQVERRMNKRVKEAYK